MKGLYMKYVILASFLVSSCVSAKEAPLQECVSVLQKFAPDNCVTPPGGGCPVDFRG